MTLGIVAIAMGLMWWFTTLALRHSFGEIGRAVIEDDLGEYGVVYEGSGASAVEKLFRAGGHDGHDQILRVVSPDGRIVLDLLLPEQPEVQWPDLSSFLPANGNIAWDRSRLSGGNELTVGRRTMPDGGELWFGRTNAADLAAIWQIHRLILLAMAITTVLCIGPVLWFANRVLRPVQTMIHDARGLTSGSSFEKRLQPSSSIPELQEFADAFNESLDRIQRLTEELEAANDQLAHELRTPLARIRGNVERILGKVKDDPTVSEDAAKAIAEVKRSTVLIQSILSIRAGDSGAMRLNLEPISLGQVIGDLYELYSAAAEEKGIALTCFVPDGEMVCCLDSQRIQQALCNLLDNAIAYTPEDGNVEIGVRNEAGEYVIYVKDDGPGIGDSDVDRIWRRFMRGGNASAEVPGIGLGLSLVRAVASAHKGSAGLNRLTTGSEFWVRLPEKECPPEEVEKAPL